VRAQCIFVRAHLGVYCSYYHRPLNPKKLLEVGFTQLRKNMTVARTIKLYSLPKFPQTPGIRPMAPGDCPAVTKLLNAYLQTFQLVREHLCRNAP
jgi:glycylpeptide N-tetradecanoyltransferase